MSEPTPRRVKRELTAAQQAALKRDRDRIADERPDLIAADQMRKEAADEPTISGELRRAIHASSLSLHEIAAEAAISPTALDEFLTGQRTLRSDVLDRLAKTLGVALSRQR